MIVENILRYYDQTRRDYNRFWHTNRHCSMHMGFHKPSVHSHDQAIEQMIYEMASRAKIRPDELVVDCGCGAGGSSLWLAENISCHVLGIDLNPRSLEIAKRVANKRGLDSLLTFADADYSKIPLGNGEADVIWFCECLCYAEKKKAVLAEAARVLKPGGRIVVADGFRTGIDGPELNEWLRSWAIPSLALVSKFHEWLEAVGFGQIRWENITANIMPSVKRLYRLARLLSPVGIVMEKLGLRTVTETANIQGCIQLYKSIKKHQCCYGIFSAVKGGDV